VHDVADHVVHRRALRDRHLRLSDRPHPGDLVRGAAEEMQDPHAALEPFPADTDELLGRPLEPGRHHLSVAVPGGPEALPVGVPPDDPVLEQLADLPFVVAHRGVREWES